MPLEPRWQAAMSDAPRFGLLLPMLGTGLSAGALLQQLDQEVKTADAVGFDLCLVPEHHKAPDGSLTDPLTVISWLTGRTSRITIGGGVLIAALHSPVRLAEHSAILHQVSGGRHILGIGAGYQPDDFVAFGSDPAHRRAALEDTVKSVKAAWAGEALAGGHVVAPHLGANRPEVWLGAWSRGGVRAASTLADGWLADPIRSEAETMRMNAWYREDCDQRGARPRTMLIRHLWLDTSDEAARAAYAPFVEPIYRYYHRAGALGPNPGIEAHELKLGGALDDRVICGSPETVTDRLVAVMGATSSEGCVFALRHPSGPPSAAVVEAISGLASDVLPAVHARLARSHSPEPEPAATSD